jgi:hypothetical protein
MKKKQMLCTMLLLAALSCTLSAQAQAVVLMEDFSGETNIFASARRLRLLAQHSYMTPN